MNNEQIRIAFIIWIKKIIQRCTYRYNESCFPLHAQYGVNQSTLPILKGKWNLNIDFHFVSHVATCNGNEKYSTKLSKDVRGCEYFDEVNTEDRYYGGEW